MENVLYNTTLIFFKKTFHKAYVFLLLKSFMKANNRIKEASSHSVPHTFQGNVTCHISVQWEAMLLFHHVSSL